MLGSIAARADLIAATLLMAGALTYVMRQRFRVQTLLTPAPDRAHHPNVHTHKSGAAG